MKLAVIVLNKTECLDALLEAFHDEGLHGATILDSHGMAHTLDDEGLAFMISLRQFLDPGHKESKTIFLVVDDDRLKDVSRLVNRVTGGLEQPDTGILFAVDVNYTEGIGGTQ